MNEEQSNAIAEKIWGKKGERDCEEANILDKIRAKETLENKNTGDLLEEFDITCKKCGSKNIHISIEEGYHYSEYTHEDSNASFKCKECGTYKRFV